MKLSVLAVPTLLVLGCGSVSTALKTDTGSAVSLHGAQPRFGSGVATVVLTMTPTSFVLGVQPVATVQVSCNSACGQVDFQIDGYEWGTVPLNAAGGFTTSGFPNVSVGSHTLQVTYQGNETYAATLSNPVSFSVVADGAAIPTVTLSMTPTSFVPSVTPSATVQVGCNSACGQVDFRIDGNEWATVALNANGSFTTSGFPGVAVGSHTLQVNYLGNATYVATASNAVNFAVVPNGMTVPAVTLTMTSTSFVLSQLPSATVQVGCNAACGLVDFRIDGNEWATVALNGNGTFVTAGLPNISLGSHTLQAFYQGNGGYAPAASNAVNFTAVPNGVTTPTVSLSMSPTSFVQGQIPTAVVQVSCNSACGYADFQIDGMEWATVPLNAGGSFTTSGFPNVSVGSHTLQVSYEGNTAYSAVVSNAVPFTVLSAGVPSGLSVSPSSLNFGSLTDSFTSAPQVVTVTNNTSAPVLINSVALAGANTGDFLLSSSYQSCSNPLFPGSSCSYSLQFQPQATGSRSAALVIGNDSSTPSLSIGLAGQGAAPGAGQVTVSPSSLQFTQFGVPQNVTLTNYGNTPLTINGFGGNAPVTQTNNCGTSLPAQSICTIAVTASGSTGSGQLTVIDDAAAGPQAISVSYTGLSGPTSFDFGGWSIGAQGTSPLLSYSGTGAVNLNGTISGANASDFFIYRAGVSPSLIQSGYCTYQGQPTLCAFTIAFVPTGLGPRTATLTMPGYGVLTLTGIGQPAGANFAIVASRSIVDVPLTSFNALASVLGTSTPSSVSLLNTGTIPLVFTAPVVTGANANQFSSSQQCGTLAPGASCSLGITVSPAQLGPISATVTVSESTGAAQHSIAVSASGQAPAPTANPTSLTFPDTQYGSVSASQVVTITAYNNDPVSVTLPFGTSPFEYPNGASCPQTPCQLSVAFAPTTTSYNSGFFYVTDTVYGGQATVLLSGTGGVPAVGLSTSALSFASRAVGSTSIAQTVTLSNSGNQVLTIGSIALAGANPGDYVLTNPCASTLAVGANCSFTVSFSPTAAGSRTATVQIVSNAASSPDVVQLSGTAQAVPLADSPMTGVVYGGSSPVAGAHVYLFAANTTGYGQGSVSLLSAVNTGLSDAVGAYVLTGADGSFSLTGDYSCSTGQQLYVYALGGDSGYGANPYAGMLAAVGPCSSGAVSLTVNEVTTVATAYALAGFMTDATHVSSSGTASAQTGVANAFATVGNLVNEATGVALTTTPAGNGGAPQATIDTLADMLATCVESSGSGCSTLFGLVTPTGGTAPADTAGAALDIAHAPANQASALYGITSSSSPFQPRTTSAPRDWTMVVGYSTINLTEHTTAMAIDGVGNVWLAGYMSVTQPSTLVKLSNAGVVLSGANGYQVPGNVSGMSVDPGGNVWVAAGASGAEKVSSTGSLLTSYNTGSAYSVAVDGAGAAWVGDANLADLFKISSTGSTITAATGISTGTATFLDYVSIDSGGNVWVIPNIPGVLEYNNSGGLISGATGYTVAERGPIAFDSTGNLWIYGGNNTLFELNSSGGLASPSTGYPTCNAVAASPQSCVGFFPGIVEQPSIAVDGLGNVFTPVVYYGPGTREYADGITEVNNAGVIVSGGLGYQTSFSEGYYPSLLQVDSSGNLWAASPTVVTELIGVAAPVETPLSGAVKDGKVGTRP